MPRDVVDFVEMGLISADMHTEVLLLTELKETTVIKRGKHIIGAWEL
jgi:hypothetical protein